jgi:hypothetical protein
VFVFVPFFNFVLLFVAVSSLKEKHPEAGGGRHLDKDLVFAHDLHDLKRKRKGKKSMKDKIGERAR